MDVRAKSMDFVELLKGCSKKTAFKLFHGVG
jgi:hypothetical protein